MNITELLVFSLRNKASDLHLSADMPPLIRVQGDVKRINLPALSPQDIQTMLDSIMSADLRKRYDELLEIDFSFELPGHARFRVNAFHQNRGPAAVLRTIPSKIFTLAELDTPKIYAELALKPRGLVLVTGPTGSGKFTTLAAMVNNINDNQTAHILTIEDPIEFVHTSNKC